MQRLKISDITRFQNINYYSNDIQKCIEEFKDDISRLYTSGWSYNEVLYDNELNRICSAIAGKYHTKYLELQRKKDLKYQQQKKSSKKKQRKKDSEERFPFLKRFVDFVFTKDEIYNPFGRWFRFEYMQPLMLLDFAKSIVKTSKAERPSTYRLASLIFVLLEYQNITSMDEILQLRGQLRKLASDGTISPGQKKIWKLLTTDNLIHNRPTIFYKPSYLYNLVGVKDDEPFEKNCNILKVTCGFIKSKNSAGEFTSKLIVGKVEKLKERYDHFRKQNEQKYQSIFSLLENKGESGIILPVNFQQEINLHYNNFLIRDKISRSSTDTNGNNILIRENNFPSTKHLKNNPLIRVSLYKNKLYCHIQSDFFMFNFVLAALYFNSNEQRRSFKKPIGKQLDAQIQDTIKDNSLRFSIVKLESKFNSKKLTLKPKSITSPLSAANEHFRQIEDSRSIINEISNNGILVDLDAIERYEKLVKRQVSHMLRNNNTELSDSVSDQRMDIMESDDDPILNQDRALSAKEKLLELEKLKDSVWHNQPNDKVGKIYGIFTPHGASTHRMTSHKLNIQGINKEIKKHVMVAHEGFCLLSADVSGQDITIAANMAKKLYSKPELFEPDISRKFEDLKVKIQHTLHSLTDRSSNIGKPIDFINDQFTSEDEASFSTLTGGETIRDFIKKAVYTFFYGGGKDSFLNSVQPEKVLNENLDDLMDSCFHFEGSVHSELNIRIISRLMKKGYMAGSLASRMDFTTYFFENFEKLYLPLLSKSAHNSTDGKFFLDDASNEYAILQMRYNQIINKLKIRNISALIYDKMEEIIKLNYKGIMESFEFYYTYYKNNHLTYPTFLGWQTVASLNYDFGKTITKSKSYPVQAAGAEFIRQWLIELNRNIPARLSGKGLFNIVNVIHDQVIVEVDTRYKDIVEKHILDCAEVAATSIGIAPNTLHIPEVKQLFPRMEENQSLI